MTFLLSENQQFPTSISWPQTVRFEPCSWCILSSHAPNRKFAIEPCKLNKRNKQTTNGNLGESFYDGPSPATVCGSIRINTKLHNFWELILGKIMVSLRCYTNKKPGFHHDPITFCIFSYIFHFFHIIKNYTLPSISNKFAIVDYLSHDNS